MAKLKMYEYPQCGTCRKAKKFFEENGIDYTPIHIVNYPPSKSELKDLLDKSGLEVKKFFNTSGKVYRERKLKDKIPTMEEDELLELLASEGKLIKRPIVTDGKQVTVGFKEEDFRRTWLA